MSKKDWEQIISNCTKAIRLNRRDDEAYFNRGLAYGQLEQYNKAISDFTAAISINPKSAPSYANRGYSYHNLEEYALAIPDYTKALQLGLDNNSVRFIRETK